MKKIIQRMLPINEVYRVTGYNYVPLIDGQGTCCDNCGKLIANMVSIVNSKDQAYIVGNDCAKTLTMPDSDNFKLKFEIEGAFNEGKSVRSKIINHIKKGNITGAYLWTSKENAVYIVYIIKKGGTSMQLLNYPNISVKYVMDLLCKKPEN